MLRFFEYDDFKKTRRTLLYFSIATFLIAGVGIIDGTIDLFGLKVIVSQQRLVSTGKIATSALLAIYLVQAIPEVLKLWKAYLLARRDKIEKNEDKQLQDSWGYNYGKDYEDSPKGELEALNDGHKWRRTNIVQRWDAIVKAAQYLAIGSIEFLMPAVFGTLCVIDPYWLDRHISASNYAQMETVDEAWFDNSASDRNHLSSGKITLEYSIGNLENNILTPSLKLKPTAD